MITPHFGDEETESQRDLSPVTVTASQGEKTCPDLGCLPRGLITPCALNSFTFLQATWVLESEGVSGQKS